MTFSNLAKPCAADMHHPLELAARNDLDGFKAAVDGDPSAVDAVGLWYGRRVGTTQMGLNHRTPLMVAAAYGSLDVLGQILSLSGACVDFCCGPEKATALHCAASGGAAGAVDAVKVLLFAGADPNAVDAGGHRPADVIVVSPDFSDSKTALEELLLGSTGGSASVGAHCRALRVSTSPSGSDSSPLSSSADEGGSPSSDSTSSPMMMMIGKFDDIPQQPTALPERKEYPVDPSLPDIKNSIYSTDEFRMYSFKVRPCSRAYSHDWTECPFAHPGENARRRDPRRFNYSCVPCPEFRKGGCRRGDSCDYAHGVFECWLHPAQYRTRLCKDGTSCSRRVCFFAHTSEEIRTVYMPTGSAVASPRSSTAIEMAMLSLLPGSPSSASAAMSPFADGINHNSLGWAQSPNVPMLHLPGSNLQSSRLRASLSARDMPLDDYSLILDFEAQQLNDVGFSSGQACLGSFGGNGSRPVRSKTLTPSNLDSFLSAEVSSSPRYNHPDHGALLSPSYKASVLNQLHHQQQSLISPASRSPFSPRTGGDVQQQCSLLQASLGISSPCRMSSRSIEPLSPLSPHLVALAQREKVQQQQQQQQQQHLRSLGSHDLSPGIGVPAVVGSPVSKWGSPSGKLDWGVNSEELDQFKRMPPFELGSGGGQDHDVSWVHSLVSMPDKEEKLVADGCGVPTGDGCGLNPSGQMEDHAVIGAWLEQMQLD